jgi:outer membrane protein assembly factor BamB
MKPKNKSIFNHLVLIILVLMSSCKKQTDVMLPEKEVPDTSKVVPNNSIVYVGSSDKNFYALKAATGTMIWKYESSSSFAYSSPSYHDGVLYVGGIDTYVYAFEAATGVIKWKKNVAIGAGTGIESNVVYYNGTIYLGTNDDYLFALDATNGEIKWRFRTDANVSSSPVIANNILYFGSSDGNLYALDPATGQLKWKFETGDVINQSGATVADNIVYVGNRAGSLFAVDAKTGARIWRYSTNNGISLEESSPTVSGGIVYIGGWYNFSSNDKGGLYAIDAKTGKLIWEKIKNTGISSDPTVTDGKLFITSDDLMIHALNSTSGEDVWQKQILPNSSSPSVANGVVFVGGGGSGYIYAFDANTGNEKWKFATPKGLMTSTPLVVNLP